MAKDTGPDTAEVKIDDTAGQAADAEDTQADTEGDGTGVPTQADFDRQQLVNALAEIRAGLANQTVMWHLSRGAGKGIEHHPKEFAQSVALLRKREQILLDLLAGGLPIPRPDEADAAGADVVPITGDAKILVPGPPSPEEVRRILQPPPDGVA